MLWDLKQETFTDVSQMVEALAIALISKDNKRQKRRSARVFGVQ